MLGDHEPGGLLDGDLEARAPVLLDVVRRIVEQWPQPPEPIRGRSLADGLRTIVAPPRRVAGNRARLRSLLRWAGGLTEQGSVRTTGPTERQATTPLPSRSRRDVVAAMLGSPILLHEGTVAARGRTRAGERVHVYLDVSGSVSGILGVLTAAVRDCAPFVHPTIHAFSTQVSDGSLADLAAGRVRTTGGTDIACVAAHAREHRVRRAVLVTDGYVGRARGIDAEALGRMRLAVAFTQLDHPADLAPVQRAPRHPGGDRMSRIAAPPRARAPASGRGGRPRPSRPHLRRDRRRDRGRGHPARAPGAGGGGGGRPSGQCLRDRTGRGCRPHGRDIERIVARPLRRLGHGADWPPDPGALAVHCDLDLGPLLEGEADWREVSDDQSICVGHAVDSPATGWLPPEHWLAWRVVEGLVEAPPGGPGAAAGPRRQGGRPVCGGARSADGAGRGHGLAAAGDRRRRDRDAAPGGRRRGSRDGGGARRVRRAGRGGWVQHPGRGRPGERRRQLRVRRADGGQRPVRQEARGRRLRPARAHRRRRDVAARTGSRWIAPGPSPRGRLALAIVRGGAAEARPPWSCCGDPGTARRTWPP